MSKEKKRLFSAATELLVAARNYADAREAVEVKKKAPSPPPLVKRARKGGASRGK